MSPSEVLKNIFGYSSFRYGQDEIIDSTLKGENVLAVLPTGAGKSLCYQIPALISENFSIVISPLIALMKDQVDQLNESGEKAAFINSTMDFRETEKVLLDIAYGKIKLLYIAPERLEFISFADRIKKLKPEYLFVDEAHCISEWGHSFRPSYTKIREFIDYVEIKKVSAYTATATPEVVKDIVEQLGLKNPKVYVKGFERDNLNLHVLITKDKKQKCAELILRYKTPAIIYTASRKKAEEISEFLNLHKIRCAYYHAGMPPEIRKKIQEEFLNDELPVIAATNAFGMGINKKDIRLIIHYNMPGSIENYYQEIGRAGRDGKISNAFLLYEDYDVNIQNFFLSSAHPDKKLVQDIYSAICDYSKVAEGSMPEKEIPVNTEYISAYCKKQVTKGLLHSSLSILNAHGYLKSLSEFEKKAAVQFIFEKNTLREFITKTTNLPLKEILLILLREYGGSIFTTKNFINLVELSNLAGYEEYEIDQALLTAHNLGILNYSNSSLKDAVVLTAPRANAARLRLDFKRINEHYLNLQKKIDTMIQFVYSTECRFKFILRYFGENVDDYSCGRCDKCSLPQQVNEDSFNYLKEIIFRTLKQNQKPISETVLLRIIRGTGYKEDYHHFSTYNTCRNYEANEIKTIIQQLVTEKSIAKNPLNVRQIFLTDKGESFLKGDDLMAEIFVEEVANYEENLELYHKLRDVRAKASKKFLQTPYVICPDEVLKAISLKKPQTQNELFEIPGFNQRMFNKVGNDFLEIINNSPVNSSIEIAPGNNRLPQNIEETYSLLIKGYPLKDIASLRKLSEAVISMQIETILEYHPAININTLFNNGALEKINREIEKGFVDLKDLKKRLPEDITFPLIRIASAKYKATSGVFSAAPQGKR